MSSKRSAPPASAGLSVTGLRCEYLSNPHGIDVLQPRLSWIVQSPQRGQKQTAYQILIAGSTGNLDNNAADLWDSGKVQSNQTIHIEYAGRELASCARCYWKVRVWDRDGEPSSWSESALWSMGLLSKNDWQGQWIADPQQASFPDAYTSEPVAMLRKTFDVAGPIARATVYATARGLYELRINGQRVGDHILAPEWTTYDKRMQYQTYDVTALLTSGANAVGAYLGEGWYVGRIGGGSAVHGRHNYGSCPMLMMQMEIELTDGSKQTIVSDASWHGTSSGPIRSSEIFDGETYDARREMPGWDQPDFDQQYWPPVHAEAIKETDNLVCQPNEPIRITRELTPIAITQPRPGMYIFDMGQNMAGWCRIAVRGDAGSIMSVRHGEALNNDGTLYTENLSGAKQLDRYIMSGRDNEVFEPHFTYHGFRYVEVTGLTYEPTLDDLVGRVFHSAAPDAGSFECSNDLVNKLISNIAWTQRANMQGIPTDCPQRDERRGWLGDIQAYAQTAVFNMDMSSFFTKYVQDMRDAQLPDGRYPNFTPRHKYIVYAGKDGYTSAYGVPAWADAGTIIPWCVYQNYGDKRMLQEHFESAKRWVDWIHSENPTGLWLNGRTRDYSDWLNTDEFEEFQTAEPPIRAAVPKEIFATAFYAHSAEIVAKMAQVLGKKEEAEHYFQRFEHIKSQFNSAFVYADGRIDRDTQAGYALALHFNIVEESARAKIANHLARTTRDDTGHLSTGFQATHRAMLELTRNGHHDEACRLINLRTCPSWGYMIDQGATTIWERWDGYIPGRGWRSDGQCSANHFAFGSVGEWLWRHIAGINLDEAKPAYEHFVIKPRPGEGFTWVRAKYDSIRGTIVSDWQLTDGRFLLEVTVPANTTATVHVPAHDAAEVTEGGRVASEADAVDFLRVEDGCAVFQTQSGHYVFQGCYRKPAG